MISREEKVYTVDPASGGYPQQPTNVWTLDTEGTNLAGTLACPDVDSTKTTSNDIVEIFTVLGVEGARAALLNEIRRVRIPRWSIPQAKSSPFVSLGHWFLRYLCKLSTHCLIG